MCTGNNNGCGHNPASFNNLLFGIVSLLCAFQATLLCRSIFTQEGSLHQHGGYIMQRTTQTGFTLTELLITIALLAIMAQIALPAWQEFISKNRSQALMHSVENAIHHARSMAVTHRIKTEL